MINLNPLSSTFGCSDRSFWHYNDLKAFNVDSFSVGMFGLSIASKKFSSLSFKEGSFAVLNYWINRIEQNHLLDEYFPHQKSFCATAYTTMAATLLLTVDNDAINTRSIRAIEVSLKALSQEKNRPISANQTLAARLAFDLFQQLTNKHSINVFELDMLPDSQLPSEYGGFDLGYALKCIDICCLGIMLIKDQGRSRFYYSLLEKYIEVVSTIVDFGFHPSMGSRGNPHGLFGGLELLAKKSKDIERLHHSLANTKSIPELVSPFQADDKYLAFFHLTSLAIAQFEELGYEGPKIELLKNNETTTISDLSKAGLMLLSLGDDNRGVISKFNGGSFLLCKGNSRRFFSGYAFLENNRAFVPGGNAIIEKTKECCFIRHTSLKLSDKTKLTQSIFISTLIKVALSTPIISKMARTFIYSKSNSIVGEPYLISRIDFSSSNVHHTWLRTPDKAYSTNGWVFVDGHATRLHGTDVSFFTDELLN